MPTNPFEMLTPSMLKREDAQRAIDASRGAVRAAVRQHGELPEGVTPELDDLRDEHHALLDRLAADREAMDQLGADFRAEDQEHEQALRSAVPGEHVEHKRTPPDERARQREPLTDRFEQSLNALADIAEEVQAHLREHEDDVRTALEASLADVRNCEEELRVRSTRRSARRGTRTCSASG